MVIVFASNMPQLPVGRRFRAAPRIRLVRRHISDDLPRFEVVLEAFPARGEGEGGEVHLPSLGVSSAMARHLRDARVCGFHAGH